MLVLGTIVMVLFTSTPQAKPPTSTVSERAESMWADVSAVAAEARRSPEAARQLELQAATILTEATAEQLVDAQDHALYVLTVLSAIRPLELEETLGQVKIASLSEYPVIRRKAALLAFRFPASEHHQAQGIVGRLVSDSDPSVVAEVLDCAAREGRPELVDSADTRWLTLPSSELPDHQEQLWASANDRQRMALRSSAFALRSLQGMLREDIDSYTKLDADAQQAFLAGVSRTIVRSQAFAIERLGDQQIVRVIELYENALNSSNVDLGVARTYLSALQVLEGVPEAAEGSIVKSRIRSLVETVTASDSAPASVKQGLASLQAQP